MGGGAIAMACTCVMKETARISQTESTQIIPRRRDPVPSSRPDKGLGT
jgi:hypothetical protein